MGNKNSKCSCLNKYGKLITLYNEQIPKKSVIINEITGESYDTIIFFENMPLNNNKNLEHFYLTLEMLLSFDTKHTKEILNLKFEKCLNYITTLLIYKKMKGIYPLITMEVKYDNRIRCGEYTFFYLDI